MPPALIGLAGRAGAGKDTAAEALLADGWQRLAFADPLKAIATAIGWDGRKDERGRHMLQELGVACRDHLGDDVWLRAAARAAEQAAAPLIVTDVRFTNEAEWIQQRGGLVIRIERPGRRLAGTAAHHISERVDDLPCDLILVNDRTRAQLHRTMRTIAYEWLRLTLCERTASTFQPIETRP